MNISIDTRTLKSGDIFIPIKGENFDGHDFINEAIQKGASAIIDEPIDKVAQKYRKKLKCPIIAITGSYGKTTLKEILTSILSKKYTVHSTQGNQNNEIGVPLTLLQGDATTDVMIIECGMRKKGDIQFLSKVIRPTQVIVTGIGVTHMEFFDSTKAIAREKTQIFQSPLRHERGKERKAYINMASPHYALLKKRAESKGFTVYAYGGETGIEQTLNGVYTIAKQFNIGDDDIKKGIEDYTPKDHRLEKIEHNGVTIIDDTYNSNPEGVAYACEYVKSLTAKRKLCVLGDMLELGKLSEVSHRQVIDIVKDAGMSVVYTIGQEMEKIKNMLPEIIHCKTKDILHEHLKNELKLGDLILLKGSRGMKLEQTVSYITSYQ